MKKHNIEKNLVKFKNGKLKKIKKKKGGMKHGT